MRKSDVGIELGSSNIKIFFEKGDKFLRIPSVVAVKKDSHKLVGVGAKAYNMLGRAPKSIMVKKTMAKGVVIDFKLNRLIIKEIFSKLFRKNMARRRICLCFHGFMSKFERFMIKSSILPSYFDDIFLIDESLASGLGAGIDITENDSFLVANIGSDTTDISTISCDGILDNVSLKVGSGNLDSIICKNIKAKYNLIIGKSTAEEIKKRAATLLDAKNNIVYRLKGKDMSTRMPKVVEVTQRNICENMEPYIKKIAFAIDEILKSSLHGVRDKVKKNGILLTGKGSIIPGVAQYIEGIVGARCNVLAKL